LLNGKIAVARHQDFEPQLLRNFKQIAVL